MKLKSGRECPKLKPITTSQRLEAKDAIVYTPGKGKLNISGLDRSFYIYAAAALGLESTDDFDDYKPKLNNEEILEIGTIAAQEDNKGSDPTTGD